jgi:lipopolysaccharide/colanic/teichoic acid biosynthesis glycosyltransferase
VKRLLDVFVALLGLIVLAPVFLAIAVAIKLESPGPAFFRQSRVGCHGRLFRIWKFRSMVADAESKGPKITSAGDPRVTRVGRKLRRLKLDELPQLLNVLTGDMSLVGPRPETPEYVALYPRDAAAKVLSVRPGITDPTALEYFDEADLLADAEDPECQYRNVLLPRKLAGYLDYLEHRSFWLDVRLLLTTIGRVIERARAPLE